MDDLELKNAARAAFERALSFGIDLDAFVRLAIRVRDAEREGCAETCQDVIKSGEYDGHQQYAAAACRDAIRRRPTE